MLAAAPSHPLAGRRAIAPAALAGARWLAGQPDLDPTTGTGLFFTRNGIVPDEVATYSSQAAAVAAAAAGEGIVLVPAHSVVDEVRRRALVRLDVRGTPVVELWHASTLGLGRALPGRAGAAAIRHDAGRDPGDLVGPRGSGVGAGAAEGARDSVAVGRARLGARRTGGLARPAVARIAAPANGGHRGRRVGVARPAVARIAAPANGGHRRA